MHRFRVIQVRTRGDAVQASWPVNPCPGASDLAMKQNSSAPEVVPESSRIAPAFLKCREKVIVKDDQELFPFPDIPDIGER